MLHYLSARETALDTREVSLSHFDECRGYSSVFRKRIIDRFLGTVGRTSEQFIYHGERLGGMRHSAPGVGYRFNLLPRVPITLIRHDDEGELGPDAAVIYQADIQCLLPPEDRIVVVELLLNALSGKSVEEG